MSNMFCFQCEQTSGGNGCRNVGVCGKDAVTAVAQDDLTREMIALARMGLANGRTKRADELIVDGLFATVTNVNFDPQAISCLKDEIKAEREGLGGQPFDGPLFEGDTDIVSLRSTLLFGMRGMAAYAHHARILGKVDDEVTGWFYKGLSELANEHSIDEWLGLLMEFGKVNFRCMELLDEANTGAYGNPSPVRVTYNIEKGPFIVVTGHDLHDLYLLLEQTKDKGINIYTHGEMLPAHAYPELHKYPHLKGHFGTAWQNQQKEFKDLPAPVLFTTNCLMPPKDSYKDRVFTTSVVAYPGAVHIIEDENGNKDFSQLIDKAIELGGYPEDKKMTGINGGDVLTTGFAHDAVLSVADKVIDAVKSGAIKHIFLVGGCDGARPGRNYYTEFVKQTPQDSVVLTLACGKFRFNDIDAGEIGGLPRIMDMGQCNDAYSAVKVALALADAFGVGVNDLPLSLVLSWYEQKAVCILLSLLALGVKNIRLGPTLPAFLSPNVLQVLADNFGIKPITTPEEDLKAILG
ncbi:hydroxylamine reductase [Mahella australiensis]|uniref:Hydroxylamine reductase n=1 Tax=Mahella australiensis (strain DSM 15567 / CIP 107919 / 50-1 BON) TaxID=697281 RepID=F3ZX06_MAHA5|nr:hydroxylamine reductase [Mahella australiensis]AEE95455.1 hybrid cluster protein [Mahella australiensis 50-1 BON]